MGQPAAGVAPGGTVSANRIVSIRETTATPFVITSCPSGGFVYGTGPLWKFGAVYAPVNSLNAVVVCPATMFDAIGAGEPNTPARIPAITPVMCWVVNTAPVTTSSGESSPPI